MSFLEQTKFGKENDANYSVIPNHRHQRVQNHADQDGRTQRKGHRDQRPGRMREGREAGGAAVAQGLRRPQADGHHHRAQARRLPGLRQHEGEVLQSRRAPDTVPGVRTAQGVRGGRRPPHLLPGVPVDVVRAPRVPDEPEGAHHTGARKGNRREAPQDVHHGRRGRPRRLAPGRTRGRDPRAGAEVQVGAAQGRQAHRHRRGVRVPRGAGRAAVHHRRAGPGHRARPERLAGQGRGRAEDVRVAAEAQRRCGTRWSCSTTSTSSR